MALRSLKRYCAAVMLCAAVLTASCAFAVSSSAVDALAPRNHIADMVERVAPTIVNIDVEGTRTIRSGLNIPNDPFFKEFFGDMFREYTRKIPMKGAGSGFIVSKDGRILTNNHVIADADKITVTFSDGKTMDAEVIGKDPTFDIAVIKVEGENLPILEMGDSDALRVGETTIAIGNTLSLGLEPTVTVGVLSARNRSIHLKNFNFDGFLQTDASINPGNSGGPLLDINGRVIGINTAIAASAQGVGFAIPINMAKQVMDDIVSYGKVRRGQMGVYLQPITEGIASALELKSTKGALVADVVPESAAEKAGIRPGDVIVKMDGKEVESSTKLRTAVRQRLAGDIVKLEIIRDGKTEKISVTLEEVDSSVADPNIAEKYGFNAVTITPDVRKEMKLSDDDTGIIITEVEEKSIASSAGLKVGDIILEANRKPVATTEELYKIISDTKKGNSALLLVKRDGRRLFVPLKLSAKDAKAPKAHKDTKK